MCQRVAIAHRAFRNLSKAVQPRKCANVGEAGRSRHRAASVTPHREFAAREAVALPLAPPEISCQ